MILLILFGAGCRRKPAGSPQQTITVSILPQKYLVEQICGNKYNVQILLPPGANHETFEPTPRDMASLDGSELYFTIGPLDFERNWLPRFTSAKPGLRVVNTSLGIRLIRGHHHGDGSVNEASREETGIDPHTWLSPAAVKIQANTIAAALSEIDKSNASLYHDNLVRFDNLVDSVDRQIRTILSCCPGKSFMIFHPALAYFARDYGLEQISIEEDGKEPSAGRIRELIDLGGAKNIRSILISKEFDVRHAEAIARELNARVIVFDPMSAAWPSNMITLAKLIAEN